jgi:hypothetical protein
LIDERLRIDTEIAYGKGFAPRFTGAVRSKPPQSEWETVKEPNFLEQLRNGFAVCFDTDGMLNQYLSVLSQYLYFDFFV